MRFSIYSYADKHSTFTLKPIGYNSLTYKKALNSLLYLMLTGWYRKVKNRGITTPHISLSFTRRKGSTLGTIRSGVPSVSKKMVASVFGMGLMPRTDDYTLMWWPGGFPTRVQNAPTLTKV